ncbi:MAG: biopolymer transporter ExbD [Verrucomicrobiales bacterium]|nr:biopolymer transporter ExbD [Verrucomicrobiales bacterium]HQW30203.1 biopolymer transporter ExbD [Verrucomicrobiales bacterium]
MTRNKTPYQSDPVLDMSPLIDLSFLLLIYFLVTSTLEPRESDLAMTLPDIFGGHPVSIDTMNVEVNETGHILLNDEVLDTDETVREVPLLLDRLKTYAESARLIGAKPVVVVAANDAAKGQRFVDVLNALADRTVNIADVSLSGFAKE